MTEAEQAYRRGCLQAVRYLRKVIEGLSHGEASLAMAAYEERLKAGLADDRAELAGAYLDVMVRRPDQAARRDGDRDPMTKCPGCGFYGFRSVPGDPAKCEWCVNGLDAGEVRR